MTIHMRQKKTQHPDWCVQDYQCTAGEGVGEHRSAPMSFTTSTGRVIGVRIRTASGDEHCELRATVRLSADAWRAEQECRRLIFHTCAALHAGLNPRPYDRPQGKEHQ